jgi:AmiR/NasT family two-component response regulator
MESRAAIEQAKGVLMARHGCTADEAFHLLAEESQRQGRKLRLVAADLVASVQRSPGPASGDGPVTEPGWSG